MTAEGVLDGLALIACALFVILVLAWIVLHPFVAVFLQASFLLTALGWRFGAHAAAS
jgi:hypothetical protein